MTNTQEDLRFIEAMPSNGDLIHALPVHDEVPWMHPVSRADKPLSHPGRMLWGRSLCGVRGRDSWGMGGMFAQLDERNEPRTFDHEHPVPPEEGWDGRKINVTCPRCVSKVRTALKRLAKGTT